LRKFSRFTLVSGTGWLIDIGLTLVLVALTVAPFWASVAGSLTAVTFVYFVSQVVSFDVGGRVRGDRYWIWLIWHGLTLPLASALVAALTHALAPWSARLLEVLAGLGTGLPLPGALVLAAGIAKLAIAPVTLAANFLVMRRLVENRPG